MQGAAALSGGSYLSLLAISPQPSMYLSYRIIGGRVFSSPCNCRTYKSEELQKYAEMKLDPQSVTS